MGGHARMNADETYAEIERIRRDMTTIRHRLDFETNPDWVTPARQRLETLEAEEQELMRKLAEPRRRA
jgi:hypothetical protein